MVAVDITKESSKREFFDEMAREHHRDLIIFARALVKNEQAAYDIVQDAFVAAWKSMERFDITKDFGAWMRGVVRNKWREYLRKNSREVHLEDDILEVMEQQLHDWQSDRQDGGPSVFIKLETCLEKLPETMAVAVQITYTQGMNSDEAADQLNISSANLRKRLERARLKLKDCLNNIL